MNLQHNNRAVSPVIGVILMVAITVILAATIGAFLLGQTPTEPTPTVSFKLTNPPGDNVTLRHTGGESVNSSSLTVYVDGSAVPVMWSQTRLTAGVTGSFEASGGETVTVVYRATDGSTSVLMETSVP